MTCTCSGDIFRSSASAPRSGKIPCELLQITGAIGLHSGDGARWADRGVGLKRLSIRRRKACRGAFESSLNFALLDEHIVRGRLAADVGGQVSLFRPVRGLPLALFARVRASHLSRCAARTACSSRSANDADEIAQMHDADIRCRALVKRD